MMAAHDAGQRQLARMTGISKSRLGALLHRNPTKRAVMAVPELEKILHALGMTLLQALACLETYAHFDPRTRERYGVLVIMLCNMFAGLPARVIMTLEEINGIDGSEVNLGWSSPLQKGVVTRIATEAVQTQMRRARMAQGDVFEI